MSVIDFLFYSIVLISSVYHFNYYSALKTYYIMGGKREGKGGPAKWFQPNVSSLHLGSLIDSCFTLAFILFYLLLLMYSVIGKQGALSAASMLYYICITSFSVALLQILNR